MARILVVDDDQDILRMAEAVLAASGHFVVTAPDAIRAMDLVSNIRFDLMLSDANMPHYSGFELIKTVRDNPEHDKMGIMMLTGRRDRKDVERAVQIGVDDYIVKPLEPMVLAQKVNQLFEKKPPGQFPEIQLAGSTLAQGTLSRPVRVDSLSELGIRVTTEVMLKPGQMIDINAEIFRELGVEAPPMKVQHVDYDTQNKRCHAQLIFLSAKPKLLQKIRRWLHIRGTSVKNLRG